MVQRGDSLSKQKLREILSDKWQRLNSLYWIIDKEGKKVHFRMNPDQERLFENMWYMNLILKDRQRGFTTVIDLYILDECIFNENVEGGIIAHREEDAKKIFRRKIKFPYDNLPDQIKVARPTTTNRIDELAFPNNSVVYVSTSMRSGTLQYLHLSEFGKVCAKFPDKAREIVSGSFEAVQPGQIIFVESTAEGREGYFYEYCRMAQAVQKDGRQLTKLDFKFFFYGWPDDPEKVLDEPFPLTEADNRYFRELESKIGRKLLDRQKWWWAAKKTILREEMKKENPGTPEEAFEAAIEGAYYSAQFMQIREEGRIIDVPYTPGIRVDTWWDLGWDDSTAIWFTQTVGKEIHVIDYYENANEGLLHYAKILEEKSDERGFRYGRHVGPHDIEVHELGPGKTRKEQARELEDKSTERVYCINFEVAPKIESQMDGIEAVRNILPYCWFDKSHTEINFDKKSVGLACLEAYRKEYNEKTESYHSRPLHNWAAHGAKAFETLAMGKPFEGGEFGDLSGVVL